MSTHPTWSYIHVDTHVEKDMRPDYWQHNTDELLETIGPSNHSVNEDKNINMLTSQEINVLRYLA